MDEVSGRQGGAARRFFAVAVCFALLWSPQPENANPTSTAVDARVRRQHAAERLIKARRRLLTNMAGEIAVADRADDLLLTLVDGAPLTSDLDQQIAGIERQAGAGQDRVSETDAALPPIGLALALALLLSLASLGLSIFLYVRRHHVMEQTLRDAGLL